MQVSWLPEPERHPLWAQHYLSRRDDLASVLDPRCYSIDWLDEQVVTGAFQIWSSDDAVVLSEVKTYPAGARDVHFLIATGSLAAISELRERAEQWGRSAGFEFVSAASRPGWTKVLGRHGYTLHQVEMRKELNDGA
jgi:hypothetical protein